MEFRIGFRPSTLRQPYCAITAEPKLIRKLLLTFYDRYANAIGEFNGQS